MSEQYDAVALQACTRCESFSDFGYFKFPTGVHGDPASSVWIVGADPRKIHSELQSGRVPQYWTGTSRRNLREPIEAHFGRDLECLVYLTDAVKCERPRKKIPKEVLERCPSLWLRMEIATFRPAAILALGSDAATSVRRMVESVSTAHPEVAEFPHPSPANRGEINRVCGSEAGYRELLVSMLASWFGRFS